MQSKGAIAGSVRAGHKSCGTIWALSSLAPIESAEAVLPIQEFVEQAVREAVVEDFHFPGSVSGSSEARRSATREGGRW